MAWSEAEVVCGRHPNENPQPGICPSCLRERLSRVAGNYYSRTINNITTSSSYSSISASPVHYCVYSISTSGRFSPGKHRGRHQRVASDVLDSIYNLAISGSKGLKKSRSMAFASKNYGARESVSGKKKGGFWNKLLLRSARKAKI
ncbi:hypothetical protein CDL12_25225 [Handroanthus impetiginosus]|uniref:Uncharacterized protein n=1 Tax=Handroanthus impetiginosus TaxID=429701 RepID=A0A2G9GAE2_9LAMI|nr:hypothetical protein CDL12_25225 [Handroanthus impetiginosus]